MRRSLGPARTAVWLAVLALSIAVAPAASAAHVECGDVLTENTKLDSDVVCVGEVDDPVTGVVIAADGITLNLNGFTVRGPNLGEPAGPQPGVRTEGHRLSITVKNGQVDGFYGGLSLWASNSTIRNVDSSGPTRLTGDGNTVRDSRLVHGGSTGLAVRGNDNRIIRNYASGGDERGIDVRGARNRIVDNAASAFQGAAIHVDQFSDVVIKRNDTSYSRGIGPGIVVVNGEGGVVSNNVTTGHDSSFGIYVTASNLLIARNQAHANWDGGIWVKGSGNTVKRNVANDNNPDSIVTYGIRVEPGNIDGGGNRASGNGAPAQCLGVVCK
jgi:parallel beta-helix repeat protein